MQPRDRQFRITDIVRTRGKVTVDELVDTFSISAETIRRDLTQLSTSGKIQKIHGGAIPARSYGEGPFAQRMQLNEPAKRLIAQRARELVSPGDTVFVDTGSTTLIIADELATIDDLTIVTNSAEIAKVISAASKTIQIYLLGGNYNADNRQTCGSMALDQISSFNGDLTIMTAAAIKAGRGVMDYSFDEAQIAQAMIERSEKVVLLADSSKFDRVAPFTVSTFDRIDALVCDQDPGDLLVRELIDAEVDVIY